MPFVFKRLALFMSIAAAFAADKVTPFRPGPAGSYPHHQVNEQVTIGADPYTTSDKVKSAFGKLDPNEHGVLPVLVVIQNDSSKTIRLDNLMARYVGPNGARIEATPAKDVKYLQPPHRSAVIPGPAGKVKVLAAKKNPLTAWEIEGRAFSAQMLPPGQTASGFFYFQTALQRGATVYLNGLAEAGPGGKELFYFEIPLE